MGGRSVAEGSGAATAADGDREPDHLGGQDNEARTPLLTAFCDWQPLANSVATARRCLWVTDQLLIGSRKNRD